MMKRLLSTLTLAALLISACGSSSDESPQAESGAEWPERGKTIDLIVGFAAGGVSDTFARTFADALSEHTGNRVQVINKPGAGTQLGQQTMLSAPADGYTMSLVSMPGLLNYIYTGEEAPFEKSDFSPIGNVGYSPNGLIVRGDSPYQTIDDVIEAAKSSSSPMNVGWNGAADDALVVGGLAEAGGVEFNTITYDGTPEKVQGLLSGDVEFFSGAIGGQMGLIESGEVRAIAQWGPERSSLVPDIPTAAEQGYEVGYDSYLALSFAAEVPAEIRDAAEAVAEEVASDPEYVQANADAYIEIRFVPGAEFADVWTEQEEQVATAAEQFAQ